MMMSHIQQLGFKHGNHGMANCHPWFTIKTILMLLRLQKLGINDIQISMTRQRQLKPWRGPYGRWAELPKMTVPVPMRFIAHIIPHISGVYTVTWSWKFVKSYNHTVQLYIIIPCTHKKTGIYRDFLICHNTQTAIETAITIFPGRLLSPLLAFNLLLPQQWGCGIEDVPVL